MGCASSAPAADGAASGAPAQAGKTYSEALSATSLKRLKQELWQCAAPGALWDDYDLGPVIGATPRHKQQASPLRRACRGTRAEAQRCWAPFFELGRPAAAYTLLRALLLSYAIVATCPAASWPQTLWRAVAMGSVLVFFGRMVLAVDSPATRLAHHRHGHVRRRAASGAQGHRRRCRRQDPARAA